MTDIAAAVPEDFEARVGERFAFLHPDVEGEAVPPPVEMELVRVTRLRERAAGIVMRGVAIRSRPFSLLFRAAADVQWLRRRGAVMEHPYFARELWLLTPVLEGSGPETGIHYEAVLN